jgi:hypothetical protein
VISASQFTEELIHYNISGIFASKEGNNVNEYLSNGYQAIAVQVSESSIYYEDTTKLHIYDIKDVLDEILHFSNQNIYHFPILLILHGDNPEEIVNLLDNHPIKSKCVNVDSVKLVQRHSTGIFQWPKVTDLGEKILIFHPDNEINHELIFSKSNDSISVFSSSEIVKPGLITRFFVLKDRNKAEKKELKKQNVKNSFRIVIPDLKTHKKYNKKYLVYLYDKKVNLVVSPQQIDNLTPKPL